MKRLAALYALGLAAACAELPAAPDPNDGSDPVFAAAVAPAGSPVFSFMSNTTAPISLIVFVQCADGGAGEFVFLEGSLHLLTHITIDGAGGFRFRTHAQPQGVTGTGLASGLKYQGTGVTQETIHAGAAGLPFTSSFVNNFRIVGQGPGNNFLVHVNTHLTVNANGEATAVVDNTSIECR